MNNTFESWMRAQYDDDQLRAMVAHGVAWGFPDINHYHETVALYDEYEDEIWDFLIEDAESLGYGSIYAYMATWNNQPRNATQMKTQLVWYTAECYAAWILSEVPADVDD